MLLNSLIKTNSKNRGNITIKGLATDSRQVKKNYIFFAIKGNRFNGEKFIKDAIYKGACAIICSKSCKYKFEKGTIIQTNDVRSYLSKVSSKFYKKKPKNIFAVTGTNGKTSVADLFYQLLRINKIPAASIGTLGIKYNNKIIKTNLTSPDTVTLHRYLHFLKKKGVDNVIIEASSHGLDQKRLHNINFKGGIFTNFSQDHLDYHKTMKAYLDTKLILFRHLLDKKSSMISDKEIRQFNKLKKISREKKIRLYDIDNELDMIKNSLNCQTSDFKLKNLAMAIKATKLCGLKDKRIFKSIKKIKEISGRLELVKIFDQNILVFIDYAHTPDALFKTLLHLKKNYGSNISLVFGCGGDRDKKKRPLMAKIANNICTKIYITDDNPRNENPKKIRQQLIKYISKNKYFNIGKRSLAINKAIQNAEPKEIILIAGKGHEDIQIYKNKISNISDKKIVKSIKKKHKLSKKKQKFLQNKLVMKKLLGKNTEVNFDGLTIDTRLIKTNNLFLAIKGKKIDGSQFIETALKKGAGCIVSSKIFKKKNSKFIKVKNTTEFLNQFAKLKREQSFAKIISITGSAGKTSLKNLLKDLLQNFGQTFSSPKSYNNHLGVPISLSNLSFDDKFAIFEVGMSRPGEIKKLAHLIKPQIGVITNIGEAHIENFKNLRGIANAKSEIIENIENGGTIILNRDDKFFKYLFRKSKRNNLKVITFGKNKKSNICLQKVIKKNNFLKVVIKIFKKKMELYIKDINVYNVLTALAVLHELKLSPNKIKSKLKKIEPSEGRGKRYNISRYKKKFKFIDESYNANPLSVKNAINRFNLIKKEKFKKYLILGDMLELGPKSKKYHEELSKVINSSDIDKVFIKGKKTIFTYKHLNKNKRGNIFQNNEDIDFNLSKMISNNDYLMIKGSNATGLNNFSKKIIQGL